MITAKEATAMSEEARRKDYEQQTEQIENAIKNACKSGMFYTELKGYYSDVIISELKQAGYEIVQHDADGLYIVTPLLHIDWSNV